MIVFSVLFFLWLLVQSGCPSPGGVCSVCAFLRSVIAVPQITQDGVDRFPLGVAIKAMPAAGQYEEPCMIVAVLCTL